MFVDDTSHGYANLYMSAQQGSNTDSHKSNGVNGGTYYGPNVWMQHLLIIG